MTQNTGKLTIEEVSKTPVYLTLNVDQSLRGKYVWYDRSEVDWEDLNVYLDCNDDKVVKEFLERQVQNVT